MEMDQRTTVLSIGDFDFMHKEDCFKYELINGLVVTQERPTGEHQIVGSNIITDLNNFLRASKTNCMAVYELDFRTIDSVLIPDIQVLYKDEDIPILTIEILSPSSMGLDLVTKLNKYKEIGVKEYWIVDTRNKTIRVHAFAEDEDDIPSVMQYYNGDTLKSPLLGLELEISELFVIFGA